MQMQLNDGPFAKALETNEDVIGQKLVIFSKIQNFIAIFQLLTPQSDSAYSIVPLRDELK